MLGFGFRILCLGSEGSDFRFKVKDIMRNTTWSAKDGLNYPQLFVYYSLHLSHDLNSLRRLYRGLHS